MKLNTRTAIVECVDRANTMAAARRVFDVASAGQIISTQLFNRILTRAIYACSVANCSVFCSVQTKRMDTGQSGWLARCEATDASERPQSTGVYCVFVTVFECGLQVEAVFLVGSNVQRTTTLDRETTTIAFKVLRMAVFCSIALATHNIINAKVLAGNGGSFVGPTHETIFTDVVPLDTVTEQDVDLLQ